MGIIAIPAEPLPPFDSSVPRLLQRQQPQRGADKRKIRKPSNLIPNPRSAHRPSLFFRIAIVVAVVELVLSA